MEATQPLKLYSSNIKLPANTILPLVEYPYLPSNWTAGLCLAAQRPEFRSSKVSPTTLSEPRSKGTLHLNDTLDAYQEALQETTKFMVLPYVPPLDQEVLSKKYREALVTKKIAALYFADAQALCEVYEADMCRGIGEADAERFRNEHYTIEDTDTVMGKFLQAISNITFLKGPQTLPISTEKAACSTLLKDSLGQIESRQIVPFTVTVRTSYTSLTESVIVMQCLVLGDW
ncbi:hypothetical protein BU15DRAFT_62171 [Melanogaster broomeanus]|nr:hypothetical protein BU15DRAFT_62171 [Melanogaster broomeanus]